MMKQENFGNIKTMQKQNRLFSLVYIINSRSEGRQIINICLMSIGIVLSLINFLSLQQINIIKNQILTLNTVINMILLPLMVLIVTQLIIGYFYQIQFFISIQWKIFRFCIYPFVTCYLLNQALNGDFLPTTFGVILFIILISLSLLLTATFSTQSYTYKKLLHRDLPINFHMLIIETLLYACSLIDSHNIKITCAFIITILAFNTYNNNFTILKEGCLQYRILSISSFMLLWYGMVLTLSLFSGTDKVMSLVIACIPCIIYKITADFTRQRAPVPYKAFVSIFQDPDTIHFEQFIQSMQPIIEQIMQYYYSDKKKDFAQTLLISYYYEHSNRCLNMNCPFKNEDFKFQLKNMNDSKNMKEVLFKMCKKIDFLYYGMYKTWPENIDLKLSLVQFYLFCFPNKIRAVQIISEIQLSKLTFIQEYEFFRVKILCQTMNNLEVVGQIKLDQRLVEFQNLVYLTLNTMMEFWTLFYQEKVDFNKLTTITQKMFPLRNKIQQIFQSRLSQQTYSSLQILKLYSLYCGTIQNNEDKSFKIKDYLDKLRSKLQQHKQIQYLSFDSQIGLVALSLSENKLGSIAMVNTQASNIFNYTKKQFKTIKVNEIMPKIFSDQHDNYLKVFLQNRTKKINSDQRKLLGKNKAGYIFPILLQLQRTVSSTGDQLLFIANIKKLKLKQASLTCVTDEEGQISDYTASFDYAFLKLQKGKFKGNKNIQEFIPQFFDPNVQEDQNTHQKHFKQMITLKAYGKVQIQYTVSQVIFPLKQNGGFIVEGKIILDEKPIQFPNLSMTHSLSTMMNRQILSGHKIFYNPTHNRYELSREEEPININAQFDKQFTIPFININDVTNILTNKKEDIVFGENIKTIRLVKNHFQRVEQASEFLSEAGDEKTQSAQAINQIMDLKESMMKEKEIDFMRNIKIAFFIISIVCTVMCILLIGCYSRYSNNGQNYLNQIKSKFSTRGYLAEYIVYYTAISSGFDNKTYSSMLESTKRDLIDSIEVTPITQNQKQEILKIVYLQDQSNLTTLLNSKTLQFDDKQEDAYNPIMNNWYIFFTFFFILIFVSISSYFFFFYQIQGIYQIFMCLEQKVIKKMYLECFNLAKKIELGSQKQKGMQKAEQQKNFTQNNEQQQDDQNPVKKIRKFKQNQSFRNLRLFIKLLLPFILVFVLGILTIIRISQFNSHFQMQSLIYRSIYSIIPQTSVFLMNTFLKNSQNYNSLVTQNFSIVYQDLDRVIFNYKDNYPADYDESYFLVLMDNVCKEHKFIDSYQDLCKTFSEGIMTVGISKAINTLATSLKDLQNGPNSTNLITNFDSLIILEFEFIFPIIDYMGGLMYDMLSKQADTFSSQYSTLTIFAIILVGLNFLYFIKYPVNEIQQKINLSKGLIDLLPEYYKSQKPKIVQGYAKVEQQI